MVKWKVKVNMFIHSWTTNEGTTRIAAAHCGTLSASRTRTHTRRKEGRDEKHSQVGSWLVVGWLVGKTDRGEVGKIWKFVWLNSTEDIFQIGDRRFWKIKDQRPPRVWHKEQEWKEWQNGRMAKWQNGKMVRTGNWRKRKSEKVKNGKWKKEKNEKGKV